MSKQSLILFWITLYLISGLFIGYFGNKSAKKSHDTGDTSWSEEFFIGAKKMGPVVLGFTFAATFASGGTFIGHPGLGFSRGLTWSWGYMCAIWCGFLPFLLLGKRCFRVGQKIKALSVADVIEYRYEGDKIVSFALMALTVFFYMSYIVSQFSAGARIMSMIIGTSYLVSLLLFTVIIIIYVTVAGMRGVAWSDTLQGIIMIMVALSIIPVLIRYGGGMEKITSTLTEIDPQLLRGGSPGTATAFGAMVSFMFVTHGFQGMGQPAAVQRLLVYGEARTFKWGTLISGFLIMFMSTTMVLAGSLGRALFPDLEIADNIIPTIILEIYPTAVCGIFLAGILAAIKSSADSYILCVSTTVTKDLVMDYMKPDMSDNSIDRLTKIITLLVGALGMFMAFNPPEFIGLLVLYAWKGLGLCIGLPLVFGCLWKRANRYGAIASMISAFIVYMYINNAYGSSFLGLDMDAGFWGLLVGSIAMVAGSLLTAPPKQEVISVFFDEDEASLRKPAETVS